MKVRRLKKRTIIVSILLIPIIFLTYYLYLKPILLQRELIGRSLVGMGSIPSFMVYEYHHQWTYTLTPEQRNIVAKFCLRPEQFSGEKKEYVLWELVMETCYVAKKNGSDGNQIAVRLVRDELIVDQFNHPGRELIPDRDESTR